MPLLISEEVAVETAERVLAELALARDLDCDSPHVAYWWVGRLEAALKIMLMAVPTGHP